VQDLSAHRSEHEVALEKLRVVAKSREDELVDQLEALALKHTTEVRGYRCGCGEKRELRSLSVCSCEQYIVSVSELLPECSCLLALFPGLVQVSRLKKDLAGAEAQVGEQMKLLDSQRSSTLHTSAKLEEHEAEVRASQRHVARLEAANKDLEAKVRQEMRRT